MTDQPDRPTDETLLAYVRGNLPVAEARRIEDAARRQPELAAEIALMRGIATACAEEAGRATPGELGWTRLSRAIDAETATLAPRTIPAPRRPIWRFAATAVVAVGLWQAVAVPLLSGPQQIQAPTSATEGHLDRSFQYAPVSEAPAGGFTVTVAFEPAATEAAIRALLREVGARVTAGPSAIGLWKLRFETEPARSASLRRLGEATDVVASVQVD